MQTLQSIAEQYLAEVDKNGYTDLSSGVILFSAHEMGLIQDNCDEEDPTKEIDFSLVPYWIMTDNGIDPIAITDAADLIDEVAYILDWHEIVKSSM